MSNWSSVIVTWSGIDRAVGNAQNGSSEECRVYQINEGLAKLGLDKRGWTIAYSCGEKSTGSACEVVAVAHFNHFDPEYLLTVLRSLKWEMPVDVQMMHKDEDDHRYTVVNVFD